MLPDTAVTCPVSIPGVRRLYEDAPSDFTVTLTPGSGRALAPGPQLPRQHSRGRVATYRRRHREFIRRPAGDHVIRRGARDKRLKAASAGHPRQDFERAQFGAQFGDARRGQRVHNIKVGAGADIGAAYRPPDRIDKR
jgi:hypothetical protein